MAEFQTFARLVEKHELELHGERGVYRAIHEMTEQLKWTNRALWGVAAAVMAGAILVLLTVPG
jgi:hypothetical protein